MFRIKSRYSVRASVDVEPEVVNSGQANPMAGLEPPAKKRNPGMPTNARDRAPYEGMSKRSRFCIICKVQRRKHTTCPQRGDAPKMPRKEAKCSNCGVAGHRKNTCDRRGGGGAAGNTG